MLEEFLNAVRAPVRQKDAEQLRNILLVEPPLPPIYDEVVRVLRARYPKGNDGELSALCENLAPPHPEGGSSWSAFGEVVRRYLVFLRDFDQNNYLNIYNTLHALLNQCNIALSDSAYGVVVLPTVLYLTKVLAKFAVALDKNPEIITAQQHGQSRGGGDSAIEKVGYVESSANVVRDAFIKCLADKSGTGGLAGPGRKGKPENKRVGIYQTANFCLRLLFQCRKLRNAEQMFVSIDNQSPPLSFYPVAQQVTFLYYLGRYHFANNHFYRAQLALQEAYNKCHRDALKQKRLILIYMITSNMCLGRFPSSSLLSRSEAAGLDQYFLPLCRLISKGDIIGFRKFLDLDSPQSSWFLKFRILLQLRDRCEVLVWRSLVRRVFVVAGYKSEDGKGMPFLRLSYIQVAVGVLQRQSSTPSFHQLQQANGDTFNTEFHPEFQSILPAAQEKAFDLENGYYLDSSSNNNITLPPSLQIPQQPSSSSSSQIPTISEIESILSSLIQQDLLNGFITHDNPRFAIPGAKVRGALATGFPNIWDVVKRRADENGGEDGVPGWVREARKGGFGAGGGGGVMTGGGGGGGGGRVVNLSGARPVGIGAVAGS
ncbi:putative pci domain-containing protein [Phaeomoniella chlamydospora]|uniref:Putative pci domain-containing protein n=1 Tax=Phaeomoniella chlamydospora TaxID=158046 RepID=A0A0G2E5W5_PHACM|nr:putative pci domain-containing protein [Phaeomoniella chlamydospora]